MIITMEWLRSNSRKWRNIQREEIPRNKFNSQN